MELQSRGPSTAAGSGVEQRGSAKAAGSEYIGVSNHRLSEGSEGDSGKLGLSTSKLVDSENTSILELQMENSALRAENILIKSTDANSVYKTVKILEAEYGSALQQLTDHLRELQQELCDESAEVRKLRQENESLREEVEAAEEKNRSMVEELIQSNEIEKNKKSPINELDDIRIGLITYLVNYKCARQSGADKKALEEQLSLSQEMLLELQADDEGNEADIRVLESIIENCYSELSDETPEDEASCYELVKCVANGKALDRELASQIRLDAEPRFQELSAEYKKYLHQ